MAETGGYNEKRLAAILGISSREVRELAKAGVITAQNGLYPPAESLVAISKHLFATRNSAEAKARAAEAEAELKEAKARAALRNLEPQEAPAIPQTKAGKALTKQKYSLARVKVICELVAAGSTTEEALAAEGIGWAVWSRWRKQNPQAEELFALARAARVDAMEEELQAIAAETLRTARAHEAPPHRIGGLDRAFNQRVYLLGVYKRHLFGSAAERAAAASSGGDAVLSPDRETELVLRIGEQQARIMAKITKGEEES